MVPQYWHSVLEDWVLFSHQGIYLDFHIPFLVEISTLLDMISNEFLRFWTLNFFYKN